MILPLNHQQPLNGNKLPRAAEGDDSFWHFRYFGIYEKVIIFFMKQHFGGTNELQSVKNLQTV